jgi:hypothetical protein
MQEGQSIVNTPLARYGVVMILLCLASNAWAQNQVANIEDLQGTAVIQRPGAGPMNLLPTTRLQYHDEVTIKDNSMLTVILTQDKTKLVASQKTDVLFDQTPLGSHIELLGGSLEAYVRPPTSVDFGTPNSHIHIHSTVFDVIYTQGVVRPGYEGCDQYTDLIVREGVVAISNPATPAVVVEVPGGYETTIPCNLPPLSPGPIGITGAPAPGNAATGRTSAAAAITGSAVPPAEVGPSFPFSVVDP